MFRPSAPEGVDMADIVASARTATARNPPAPTRLCAAGTRTLPPPGGPPCTMGYASITFCGTT